MDAQEQPDCETKKPFDMDYASYRLSGPDSNSDYLPITFPKYEFNKDYNDEDYYIEINECLAIFELGQKRDQEIEGRIKLRQDDKPEEGKLYIIHIMFKGEWYLGYKITIDNASQPLNLGPTVHPVIWHLHRNAEDKDGDGEPDNESPLQGGDGSNSNYGPDADGFLMDVGRHTHDGYDHTHYLDTDTGRLEIETHSSPN